MTKERVQRRPSLKEIKHIFPQANGVGMALPDIGRGLVVWFRQRADFFSQLGIETPSASFTHSGLFELTREFSFVVLKNCKVSGVDGEASQLSRGVDSDGHFIQDPFHYDVLPPDQKLGLPQEDYISALYKRSSEERPEDTFYAIEEDVRQAITKLPIDHLNDEVQEALQDMMQPTYHFRLFNTKETPARKIIRQQYPEFVEDVFNLIPDGRKYRQSWLKDQWDIFIQANTFGDALHARPTGHYVVRSAQAENILSGLYLFKG